MADSSPDYKALYLEQREKLREEKARREEKSRRREEETARWELVEARIQNTTFEEFIRYNHTLLSQRLRFGRSFQSTIGTIPLPKKKHCPTRLEFWADCAVQQEQLYRAVYAFLHSQNGAQRLFTSLSVLDGLSKLIANRPINHERELEFYEWIVITTHVEYIITELCKIDDARDEFGLSDEMFFEHHKKTLDETELEESEAYQNGSLPESRADHFCIRVDGGSQTLLTTAEYKPPNKLSVETFRAGLEPMNLWENMVVSDQIPTDPLKKLKWNAQRLVCSAIVEEYHVMIEEGLEYSYLSTGVARVLLRVPHDDPSTLYYSFCDPHTEVDIENRHTFQQPLTSLARVLCICLMSLRSPLRDQGWRNDAISKLHTWTTGFEHTRSQIPKQELKQTPPAPGSTENTQKSVESSSSYQQSSPDSESSLAETRRVPNRSQEISASMDVQHRTEPPDSNTNHGLPESERGYSQIDSSPSPTAQQPAHQQDTRNNQSSRRPQHNAKFCTQRCLLGLQQGDILDSSCPNVALHQQGRSEAGMKHLIKMKDLISLLKTQLDENLDQNCTPFGRCGSYGAPFKLTCATYGYTVVGKGTTSGLWSIVSREAQVYQILQHAQGSAVPVFLGSIDLAKTYFLHGAGQIRHMLVMAWGGESTAKNDQYLSLRREIRKSRKEIQALGVFHDDLRPENILWNEELSRALIIDFHRSRLNSRPLMKRSRVGRRSLGGTETQNAKRLRIE